MRKEPTWISKLAVFALHERLLAEHGGAPGLLDEGLLDAALASPRNHFAYQQADIFRLAAAYAHSITQNHPFCDGNKRVALTVAGVFLELNGYRLDAPEPEAVAATMGLSTKQLEERGFAEWLRASSSRLPSRQAAQARKSKPRKKK